MQKLDNPPSLITISRAAAIMGVSIKTLRRWESEGKLKPHRNRLNHRLYSLSQLTQYQQKIPPSSHHKLTISEAAKHLGVSVKTLRRWDNSGKVSCRRDSQGNRIYDQLTLNQLKSFKSQSEWVRLAPVRKELQSFGYKPLYPLMLLLIANSVMFAINKPIYDSSNLRNEYYKNLMSDIQNDVSRNSTSPLSHQNAPIEMSAAIHPDYVPLPTPTSIITDPNTHSALPEMININLGPVVASDFQQLTQSTEFPSLSHDEYIEIITNIYKEYLIQTNVNNSSNHLKFDPDPTLPSLTLNEEESPHIKIPTTNTLQTPLPSSNLTAVHPRIYDNSPPPASSLTLTALENTENGPMEELFALQHQALIKALSGNSHLQTYQLIVPATQTNAQLVIEQELNPASPMYLTPQNDYSPALRYWSTITPGCLIHETGNRCSTITIHFDHPVDSEVLFTVMLFKL